MSDRSEELLSPPQIRTSNSLLHLMKSGCLAQIATYHSQATRALRYAAPAVSLPERLGIGGVQNSEYRTVLAIPFVVPTRLSETRIPEDVSKNANKPLLVIRVDEQD